MFKLSIKIIVFPLFFFHNFYAYCQLTLEDIFLTDKYAARTYQDIAFLHRSPIHARFINVSKGKNIGFFNRKNEQVDEWKLSEFVWNEADTDRDWSVLTFSNTDSFFLLGRKCETLYRYASSCDYVLGDAMGILTDLSEGKQYFPHFSPDDKKIAFVKYNNLYYRDILRKREVQITKDGVWNKIINGKSDWVFEEELELTRGFEWNASGDKIAYLKFDETNVKESSLPMYYDLKYPDFFRYKYPKVGEDNARVSIWWYDTKSSKNYKVPLPVSYEYIPRIYWNGSGNEIVAMLLNRHQDTLQLVAFDSKTKKLRQLYLETDKAYVEVPNTVRFLSDNSFLITSEKDGHNHLYHYDKDGKLIRQLTKGDFEILNVYGVDEKNKMIYYQSNEGNEIETAIYKLNYEQLTKQRLSRQNGNYTARFSGDFSYYIQDFSNAATPPQTKLQETDAENNVILENNEGLSETLKNFPQKEFVKIPVNNQHLNAWIIKPLNRDSTKKYPLLMYVYGGPGDREVLNKWENRRDLFYNFLAEQGYVVACVDNTGTGNKGAAFKKATFLHLGKLETSDQAAVANYFSSLPYVDKNRIAIFGWSYGGYIAMNALLEANDIFKAAIAVAPITNWSIYDNVYTERYMRTPKENPLGYYENNPVVSAHKLKGNLLMIHGMSDDNVQLQHTIQMANALNEAHKTYQLYLYPDKDHSISGKQSRYDLFSKIYQFIREKL